MASEAVQFDLRALRSVEATGVGFIVRVEWDGGEQEEIDLAEEIHHWTVYRPLRDEKVFASVRIAEHGYGIEWAEAPDLGMSPDQLSRLAEKQRAHDSMRPSVFKFYRKKSKYTQEAMAQALGRTKRQIVNLEHGRYPVNLTTSLALMTTDLRLLNVVIEGFSGMDFARATPQEKITGIEAAILATDGVSKKKKHRSGERKRTQ